MAETNERGVLLGVNAQVESQGSNKEAIAAATTTNKIGLAVGRKHRVLDFRQKYPFRLGVGKSL